MERERGGGVDETLSDNIDILLRYIEVVLRRPLLYHQWHACGVKWVMN